MGQKDAKWLVMSLEDGNLVPRCKHRKCLNPAGAYLTNDCQCYNRKASDVCGVNEQLYDDIFGQGVCGCSPGHAIWEGDDACHPVHQQGPCEVGQLFVVGQDGRTECIQRNCTDGLLEIKSESEENCFEIGDTAPCEQGYQVGINPRSLIAECIKSEERLERVFDLIPANQNQHSNNGHNSVNKGDGSQIADDTSCTSHEDCTNVQVLVSGVRMDIGVTYCYDSGNGDLKCAGNANDCCSCRDNDSFDQNPDNCP